MIAFLLCILAVAVTGGSIAANSYFGITVIYLILGALFISYAYYFITRREALRIGSAEKCLLAFEGWALLHLVLSLAGVNQIFQADLAYDSSFIPRQAVYLFVLPAVILFREDTYMKKVDWFLKRYGEILFWILYFAQMFYFHQVVLTVIAQGLLCWLSLRLETNQRWRRWARILALMAVPLFEAGETTILIIRMIFFAICIFPKQWARVGLCLMAVVVFSVLAMTFVLPVTVGDTFFSDWNMAWRARTWADEEKILANTYLIGAGYGTSYPSKSYAETSIARGERQYTEGDGYTQEERVFVTAPHNSFMSLSMRTGIIGLALFISFLILSFRNMVKHKAFPSRSRCFALLAGIMMISFNVGLESPGYLLAFVFFLGMCAREGKKAECRDNE